MGERNTAGFFVDAQQEVDQAVLEQMRRVSSSSSQFDLCLDSLHPVFDLRDYIGLWLR